MSNEVVMIMDFAIAILDIVVIVCVLIIGLILGYRIGLEKALKDPHYAHGFIEGFGFRPLLNMIRGKNDNSN